MKNTFISEEGEPRKFVGFWHYGVILTYLSVVAAVVGIYFSAKGRSGIGVICLLISGICDAFDGAVAKTRKNRTVRDRNFGEQIDSLSDLVAFGVAPVMIGFGLGMRRWFYIPVYVAFVLCALIRLAYYNVTEEERITDGSGDRTSFEGLPVTNVAVALPVFWLFATMFIRIHNGIVTQLIMAAAYLIIAFLFVYRFRMPKAKVRGILITILILTIVLAVLFSLKTFWLHL
ncbi:MAG: CDP-alcohol phosphatidyltransferase family protein [Candidatus Gallimonas sp.]